MNVVSALRSRLLTLLMSERVQKLRRRTTELRRRLGRRPHTVSAFLELDDPWSALLAHYLPALAEAYAIDLRCYLAEALDGGYRPRPDMLAAYAEQDCARIAPELGVPFLDRGKAPPVEHRRALTDALAASADGTGSAMALIETISRYWRGDAESITRRAGDRSEPGRGAELIARNQSRLRKLGHYNTAMLHYGGEWYWGVDRLHYLTERLDALGLQRETQARARLSSISQAMHVSLPVTPPSAARDLPPLEFFFSFRSPYSYLSMRRVFALADAFGLRLELRPVLPMVMRGLPVPQRKLLYIGVDTSREARRLGIPFGRFTDPLGRGVERCLAAFCYAVQEKRARDFVIHAGEAIWARGIDVATDSGMRKVTARTGLFWPDVVEAMNGDAWRPVVEANREDMTEAGAWGVPTLRLGDYTVWGQDRLWLLARHIEEHCDTGEGILV